MYHYFVTHIYVPQTNTTVLQIFGLLTLTGLIAGELMKAD